VTEKSSARTSKAFATAMQRMMANWPIADELRQEVVTEEYRTAWDEVGPDRFVKGVIAIIKHRDREFFPPCGEFRKFIPDAPKWEWDNDCPQCLGTGFEQIEDYHDLPNGKFQNRKVMPCTRPGCHHVAKSNDIDPRWADRERNPDEYFGEADVVCMMRIAKSRKENKLSPLNEDDMIAAVLEARKQYTRPRS
jgi:hypothetical protein